MAEEHLEMASKADMSEEGKVLAQVGDILSRY